MTDGTRVIDNTKYLTTKAAAECIGITPATLNTIIRTSKDDLDVVQVPAAGKTGYRNLISEDSVEYLMDLREGKNGGRVKVVKKKEPIGEPVIPVTPKDPAMSDWNEIARSIDPNPYHINFKTGDTHELELEIQRLRKEIEELRGKSLTDEWKAGFLAGFEEGRKLV